MCGLLPVISLAIIVHDFYDFAFCVIIHAPKSLAIATEQTNKSDIPVLPQISIATFCKQAKPLLKTKSVTIIMCFDG